MQMLGIDQSQMPSMGHQIELDFEDDTNHYTTRNKMRNSGNMSTKAFIFRGDEVQDMIRER